MAYDIGPKIGIDGESEFRNAINGINENLKTLGTEMKVVASQFDKGDNSVEALSAANEVLNKQIDEQKNKLNELQKGLTSAAEKYGENDKVTQGWQRVVNQATAELNTMERQLKSNNDVIESAKNQTDDLSKEFEQLGNSAENASDNSLSFADILKANLLSSAIISGIQLLVNGFKELGSSTIGFVTDSNTAFNDLVTKTGAVEEEFDGLKQTMNDIYANNFGADIQDVADSMAVVKQQTDLSGESLKNMTEQALLLRDSFEFDVSDSVRSANMLMDTFGLSSEEAYNLITQGAQNGLDKNGDLLDTINEYSGQFSGLGLSAEDMFNMLANGAEGGTFSVDKLGDAVKEFGIRVKDGSDSTNTAFADIGLNADDMAQKFGAGGDSAKQAMTETVNAIFSIKDPLAQNVAGIALFGTQWEDLGASGIKALTNLDGAISTTSSALDNINQKKYDDIGSAMEGLGRQIQTSISEPLEKSIMPIIQEITDYVKENGSQIAETVGNVAEKVGELVEWIVDNKDTLISAIAGVGAGFVAWNVVTMIQGVVGAIKAFQLANEGATIAQAALNAVMNANPIGIIITAVASLVAIIGTLWATNEDFREGVKGIWNGITETVSGAIEKVKEFLSGVISFVKDNWQSLLLMLVNPISGAFKLIYDNNEVFRTKINELVENIKTFFVDLGKSIGELPGKLKEHFDNGVQKIQDFANSLKEKAIEAAKNVLTQIVSGLSNLPDNLKSIGINAVKGIWNGMNSLGTWIVKSVIEFGGDIITGLTNGLTGIADIGINLVKGIWNGISNATDWILDKIKGFGASVLNGIKSVFGIHSPSTVFRDEVGKYLAQGLGEGFVNEMSNVTNEISSSIPKDFEIDASYNVSASKATTSSSQQDLLNSIIGSLGIEIKATETNGGIFEFIRLEAKKYYQRTGIAPFPVG